MNSGLTSFRAQYPEGGSWLVASDTDQPHRRAIDGLNVQFRGLGAGE